MQNLPRHALYGFLLRLSFEASESTAALEFPVELECPSIMVGDDPELDALVLEQIQSILIFHRLSIPDRKLLDAGNQKVLGSFASEMGSESPDSNVHLSKNRFSSQTVAILNNWLFSNQHHPFPSVEEKQELMESTGLSSQQLAQWFTNARRRQLKKNE